MADGKRKTGTGKEKGSGKPASSMKPLLVGLTAFVVAAIGVTALLAGTGGSGGSSGASGSFTPNDEGLIQPGEQAPQTTAETLSGGGITLPTPSDGPTLITFFATWCPHCNDEAPVLSDLSRENEDLDVVMAGMDGEDDPQKIEQFVEEYDIQGQAFYEPSVGQTYQVTGYPTTYVIDGSGEVVGANSGETPEAVLQGWIDQARQG